MPDNTLILCALLSQVVCISYYFPRKVLAIVRGIEETYPPTQYAKLYPVAIEKTHQAQHIYGLLNSVFFVLGLGLVGYGFYEPTQELLGWDSQMVILLYFGLQITPWLVIYKNAGFIYFNTKRKPDSRSTRTAELQPRRLFDFVPPKLMAIAFATFAGFVLIVLLAPELWGDGYWNILFITVLNAYMAVLIVITIRGKKKDPYLGRDDRHRQREQVVRFTVAISIIATLFLLITNGLKPFGHGLDDIVMSLYLQLICLLQLRLMRIDGIDFKVYRAEQPADDSPIAPNMVSRS